MAPTGNIGDGPEYPPGSGVPQWQLLENKALDWKVAAFIGPGQVYDGMYL